MNKLVENLKERLADPNDKVRFMGGYKLGPVFLSYDGPPEWALWNSILVSHKKTPSGRVVTWKSLDEALEVLVYCVDP